MTQLLFPFKGRGVVQDEELFHISVAQFSLETPAISISMLTVVELGSQTFSPNVANFESWRAEFGKGPY